MRLTEQFNYQVVLKMDPSFRGTVAAIVDVATKNVGYDSASGVSNIADYRQLANELVAFLFKFIGNQSLEFKLKSPWKGSVVATLHGVISAVVGKAKLKPYCYTYETPNKVEKQIAFQLISVFIGLVDELEIAFNHNSITQSNGRSFATIHPLRSIGKVGQGGSLEIQQKPTPISSSSNLSTSSEPVHETEESDHSCLSGDQKALNRKGSTGNTTVPNISAKVDRKLDSEVKVMVRSVAKDLVEMATKGNQSSLVSELCSIKDREMVKQLVKSNKCSVSTNFLKGSTNASSSSKLSSSGKPGPSGTKPEIEVIKTNSDLADLSDMSSSTETDDTDDSFPVMPRKDAVKKARLVLDSSDDESDHPLKKASLVNLGSERSVQSAFICVRKRRAECIEVSSDDDSEHRQAIIPPQHAAQIKRGKKKSDSSDRFVKARKIMDDNELAPSTQSAMQDEKDRMARLVLKRKLTSEPVTRQTDADHPASSAIATSSTEQSIVATSIATVQTPPLCAEEDEANSIAIVKCSG